MNWKHLPNAISGARLAATPLLAALAAGGQERAYFTVLLIAWLTDPLDGWLARRYGWTSRLGALLDSLADLALALVVVQGIVVFHGEVIAAQGALIGAVLGTWTLVHGCALLRYRRLAAFHTPLVRLGMVLFGLYVAVLYTIGPVSWLLLLMLGVCLAAGVENLLLVFLRDRPGPEGG